MYTIDITSAVPSAVPALTHSFSNYCNTCCCPYWSVHSRKKGHARTKKYKQAKPRAKTEDKIN